MGIGLSMGFPPGMIAGAVICGSLFGDKMSPFSDTTNLAPAMAGGTLYGHIKSMCYNTIPGLIITAIIFAVIGSGHTVNNYDPSEVLSYQESLAEIFNIGFIPVIPMIMVIVLLFFKLPALPTILLGAIVGGICAMISQGSTFIEVVTAMRDGFSVDSGVVLIDSLLNRGGISSMYGIMMIMIFAMGLGGMLDKMGILHNFLGLFIHKVNSVFSLVASTMIVSYLSGAIGCTMSMSHVLTGKLMGPIYREKGVSPDVCSRTMEDCGTLGGTLMPWHTNAVYFCGTLGVLYTDYIPFVFLCYIVPIISLIYAATGLPSGTWIRKPASASPKNRPPSTRRNTPPDQLPTLFLPALSFPYAGIPLEAMASRGIPFQNLMFYFSIGPPGASCKKRRASSQE